MALDKYRNRIPEIGLVGFDYADWCSYTKPPISLIDQPAYLEGYNACKLLIDTINGLENINKKQVLQSKLIERDTTDLK